MRKMVANCLQLSGTSQVPHIGSGPGIASTQSIWISAKNLMFGGIKCKLIIRCNEQYIMNRALTHTCFINAFKCETFSRCFTEHRVARSHSVSRCCPLPYFAFPISLPHVSPLESTSFHPPPHPCLVLPSFSFSLRSRLRFIAILLQP